MDDFDPATMRPFSRLESTTWVNEETLDAYIRRMERIVTYLTYTIYDNEEEHLVLLHGLRDVWDLIKHHIQAGDYAKRSEDERTFVDAGAIFSEGSSSRFVDANEHDLTKAAITQLMDAENYRRGMTQLDGGEDEQLSKRAISRYINEADYHLSKRTPSRSTNTHDVSTGESSRLTNEGNHNHLDGRTTRFTNLSGGSSRFMDPEDSNPDEYDLSRTANQYNYPVAEKQASSSSESDLMIFESDSSKGSSKANSAETTRLLALFCPVCRGPKHTTEECPGKKVSTENHQPYTGNTGRQMRFCSNCKQGGHSKKTCWAVGGGREGQRVLKPESCSPDYMICSNCSHYGHHISNCWAPGGGKDGQKPSRIYPDIIACSNCKRLGHQIGTCWATGGGMAGQKPPKGEIVYDDTVCPNCLHCGHVVEMCWAPGGGRAGQGTQRKAMSRDGPICANCKLEGHRTEECWAMGGGMEGRAPQDIDPGRGLTCSNCRQQGHTAKTCGTNDVKKEAQKAYISRAGLTCTNCKRDGHTIMSCWMAGGGREGQAPHRDAGRRGGPICANCKREGHSIETCWGHGGGLAGQAPRRPKPKNSDTTTANGSSVKEDTLFCYAITEAGSTSTPTPNPFNNFRNRILVDSACTNHVTWRKDLFVTYKALRPGEKKIALADGSLLSVDGVGTIAVNLTMEDGNPDSPGTTVELKNVIHFKHSTTTLLSLAQLRESDIQATFAEGTGFFMKHRATNAIIGKTVLVGRLYVLLVKGQNLVAGSTSSVSQSRRQVVADEINRVDERVGVDEECGCPRCLNDIGDAGDEGLLGTRGMRVFKDAVVKFVGRPSLVSLMVFMVCSSIMGVAFYILLF